MEINILLYTISTEKTTEALTRAGNPIPGKLNNYDGLVHSIKGISSPVNTRINGQTQTQQFKRWFGNSAVADENGEPIVMYHGSIEDFDTFVIESDGDQHTSLYYINRKKATEFLKSGRVLIPVGSESFDGVVHSITEPNSPVKVTPIEQMQTQQFK